MLMVGQTFFFEIIFISELHYISLSYKISNLSKQGAENFLSKAETKVRWKKSLSWKNIKNKRCHYVEDDGSSDEDETVTL